MNVRAVPATEPFGSGDAPDQITYATIAKQVAEMQTRALTPDTYSDVLTLIEYMRDEALRTHSANETRSALLDQREQELARRERDVALRGRAVTMAMKGRPVAGWRVWRYFWR